MEQNEEAVSAEPLQVESETLLDENAITVHHAINEEEVISAVAASSLNLDSLETQDEPAQEIQTTIPQSFTLMQKIKTLLSSSTIIVAIFTTFVTHTCFGLHPIFSRYLQQVSHIPTLALVSMCNLVVLAVYLPLHSVFQICKLLYAYTTKKEERKPISKESLKVILRQQWHWVYYVILTNYVLILFAIVLVLRSVTNFLSSRFTKAIYVQLIALGTPFFVSFLTLGLNFLVNRFAACQRFFKTKQFSNESLEWQTLVAICATCLGLRKLSSINILLIPYK